MIQFGTRLIACIAVASLTQISRAADETEMIAQSGAMEIVLLRQPSVQKELKLTEAHGKKIHEFASEQWKKAKEIHKLPEAQQDAKYDALTQENEKFLGTLLAPEQRKRLDQIAMQVAGLLWAGRPDVESALKLTSQQKEKISALHKEAHKEAMAIVKEAKDDKGKEADLKKLHDTNHNRLLTVLTPEQKELWKTMVGQEFKGEFRYMGEK